ncbi:MAG TPA: hypothetical protein VN428_20580 [Bryobacteraceae bacterium]|nr:hypothetical protein [Bryobacteraceae bacterium]
MGKKDVIKPGHFKLAGRLRPGQDIVQEDQKQEFATEQAREEDAAAEEAPLPGMKPKPKRTMAAGKGGGTGSAVKRRRK